MTVDVYVHIFAGRRVSASQRRGESQAFFYTAYAKDGKYRDTLTLQYVLSTRTGESPHRTAMSGKKEREETMSRNLFSKYGLTGSLAFLSLVFSCAEPNEDEPLAEQSDDPSELVTQSTTLLNATTTTLRPETGALVINGILCTATLITPNWFISAAHCNNYGQSNSLANSTLAIGGTLHNVLEFYTVDGQLGTHDVAIGRIDANVPAATATPARLAIRHPVAQSSSTTGDSAVIMGFGCDNRSTELGGGVKRFANFTWQNSNRICPGDSGGPVRYGTLTSISDLFAINSIQGDGFALPVSMYERIWAIIRSRSMGVEANVNRSGATYETTTIPSAGGNGIFQCRGRCELDHRCRSFSYSMTTQSCQLKSAAGRPTTSTDVFSGVPSSAPIGSTNRMGSDFATVSATSVDHCQSICATFPSPLNNGGTRCMSYSYGNGTCWLKSAAGPTNVDPTLQNGVRHTAEVNFDRQGSTYRTPTLAIASADFCQFECQADSRCRAYTYTASTRRCELKDAVGVPTASTGRTSGVRRGLEIDVDRWGSDFRNFSLPRPEPEICQTACDTDPLCKAWTYAPPVPNLTPDARGRLFNNPVAQQAHCFLKNAVPAATTGVLGLISGRAGMAFF